MKFTHRVMAMAGLNPFRARKSFGWILFDAGRYALASLELYAVFLSPAYAAFVRRKISRPVNLMVIGAQKSGTTWVYHQMLDHSLAEISTKKECHHFDRGRMGTLGTYFRQYQGPDGDRPVVEIAPDYGPISKWRIKAIAALFPELRIAFIARDPVARAWSGTRMETAFDRGLSLNQVPARDMYDHLCTRRSHRYSDYAALLQNWVDVFGAERLRIFPFDMINNAPKDLLAGLLEHAAGEVSGQTASITVSDKAVFAGEPLRANEAIHEKIRRDYEPYHQKYAAFLRANGFQSHPENRRGEAPSPPREERAVLVVCGFAPNPESRSSGQKLAFQKILELGQDYNRVDIVYFINRLDRLDSTEAPFPWPKSVQKVTAINLTISHRMMGALRWPMMPLFASSRRYAARKVIEAHLASPVYTDFFADFSQGLAAVPPRYSALFAFRQHDIVSRLYGRKAQYSRGPLHILNRFEETRTQRWEHSIWGNCLRLETLSNDDRSFVQTQFPEANIVTVPAKSTVIVRKADRHPKKLVEGRLIYWGNMSRHENIEAARRLATDILPRIRKIVPGAHLWIAGAHPTRAISDLESPSVHVTGFLHDPSEAFHSAAVAVVPLRLGSGVKIKVLETLDAGIPTVVSLVGAEGIPPHDLMKVAQTDEEFVAMVCDVLQYGSPQDLDCPAESKKPRTKKSPRLSTV